MNRNLVIGGLVAAALHGGALLVFPRGPVPDIVQTPVVMNDPPVIEIVPEVEPPDTQSSSEQEAGSPEPPAPRGPEEPSIHRSPIEFERKPHPHVEVTDVLRIPKSELDFRPGGTGGKGRLIDAIHLDNPPRTRTQTSPIYPREARNAKLNGEVIVEFTVDETGRVLNPRVVRSSDRVFEDATLRAVAKWRFEPGRRLGQIVRFRMAVPVVFGMER